MSKLVKDKFWDCIQARRAWRGATFIMHELCGVKPNNYDSFHLETNVVWGKDPKKSTKKKLKFGTFLMVLCFGPFGPNATTNCSTVKQWHESQLKHNICRRNNLNSARYQKQQNSWGVQLFDGAIWWAWGCPWLGGSGGGMWWGYVGVTFYMMVFRVRGAPPPLVVGAFSWFLNAFGVGFVGFLS